MQMVLILANMVSRKYKMKLRNDIKLTAEKVTKISGMFDSGVSPAALKR